MSRIASCALLVVVVFAVAASSLWASEWTFRARYDCVSTARERAAVIFSDVNRARAAAAGSPAGRFVASVSSVSDTLHVFKAKTDGALELWSSYACGSEPVSITCGDFNTDSWTDVAVADSSAEAILVFLGSGFGTFGTPTSYPIGGAPAWVVRRDLDGDRRPELLAVTDEDGGSVAVLTNNGSGSFSGGYDSYEVGTTPVHLTTAELDDDSDWDVAVANRGSDDVSVLIGDGSGGLSEASSSPYDVDNEPRWVSTGDLDDDDHNDIAVACGTVSGGSVVLLMSTEPDSTAFAEHANSPISAVVNSRAVEIGGFVGDDLPDLMVLHDEVETQGRNSYMSVYENDGSVSFSLDDAPVGRMIDAWGPRGFVFGYVDMDIFEDVLTFGEAISVFAGTSSGVFQGADGYESREWSYCSVVTQANALEDTLPDIVVASHNDIEGCVQVFLNDGSGGFSAPDSVYAGDEYRTKWVIAADVWPDANDLEDLVVANESAYDSGDFGSVAVLSADGDGTYTLEQEITPAWSGAEPSAHPTRVAVADLDEDGYLDILVATRGIDGDGAYSERDAYITFLLWDNTAGEFQRQTNQVRVHPTGQCDREPWGLVTADFDQDGHADMAYVDGQADAFKVQCGNGDCTFDAPESYGPTTSWGGPWTCLATDDMNHDSYPDLIMATSSEADVENLVFVRLNRGLAAGPLLFPDSLACSVPTDRGVVNPQPYGVATGDVNGDGYSDVAVVNHWRSDVAVFEWDESENELLRRDTFGVGQKPTHVQVHHMNLGTGDSSHCDLIAVCEIGTMGNLFVLPNKETSAAAARAGRASKADGLQAVVLKSPTFPNPSAGRVAFTLPIGTRDGVSVEVYDVSGRLVRRLPVAPNDDGRGMVEWDGRTEEGLTAASGVYFWRAAVGDDVVSGKVALLR